MSIEAESFAFGSSIYGGRPTFALTRQIGDEEPELTLYEFAPKELAGARSRRFESSGSHQVVMTVPLDEVVNNGTHLFSTTPSTGPQMGDWKWDNWCGIKIETLRGKQLRAARSLIRSVLGETGQDGEKVLSGKSTTLFLAEGVGVRLALCFLGLKPIQRFDRLDEFATGISRLSLEECYYWHAKARSPTSPNGIKALRVLLTDHVN